MSRKLSRRGTLSSARTCRAQLLASATPTVGQLINALEVGKFLRVCEIHPVGALEARRLARSVQLYWRFTLQGKTERQAIGAYDSSAPPKSSEPTAKGYSIAAARKAAEDLAARHHAARDTGGHAALKQAKKHAEEAAAEEVRRASEFTLAALLDDYCDHNEKQGKLDVADVRRIFRLHITEPFPEISAQPAAACTGEDFIKMMVRLQEAGKKRTSNKLRSYARAAFEVAFAAKTQAAIPPRFKLYGIKHNPLSDTRADPQGSKPDKNPLSLEQMRLYWSLIEHLPDLRGAALRIHLLSGAQRIKQLVRATTAEVKDNVLMLWDGKGKPGKGARPHPIPMTPLLAKAVADCKATGQYVMSTDGGETHLANTTLGGWAQDVVGDRIPGFEAKHLRSGVETLLARAAVGKEARGRLQSHGVGGVQDSNYNAYDYLLEKLEALETLEHWLTATPEVELEKQRAARAAARKAQATTSNPATGQNA